MAVYKDKERGTWYAMIRYTDEEGKSRSKIKRGFELKRDAIRYESMFREDLHANDTSNEYSFKAMFDEYLESLNQNNRSETLKEYKRVFHTFLSNLEKTKIKRLTSVMMQKQVNQIKSLKYSRSYLNKALRIFKSVLKYSNEIHNTSFKLGIITSIPKTTDNLEPFTVWNNDDFNKFIEFVDSDVYKTFFTFLYRTGARRGEAIALKTSDLKGNVLSISKSMKHFKNGSTPTKTMSSVRIILIDEETLKMLHQINHGDYLFGGEFPLSITGIQRVFTKAIEDSGVKKIRLHDLRHSHATNLINNGANIVAVSRRLGHSDISMTLKVYTHLLEKTEKELLNFI